MNARVLNNLLCFLAFIRSGFRRRIVYRASTLWGLVSSSLVLFLQIKLWQVLLSSAAIQDDRTLAEMVAYLVINALLIALTKCGAANTLAAFIRDGSIANAMTRPLSLKTQIVCEQIGDNLHTVLFTVLCPSLFAVLLYGAYLPDAAHILLFAVSALFGAIIIFEIQYILGMVAFYLTSVWFASFFVSGFMHLFGGTTIPIWYYPDWLANICTYLPFRYITYEPILIFLQSSQTPYQTLWIQLIWIAVLLLLEKLIWRNAERKLVVQGG